MHEGAFAGRGGVKVVDDLAGEGFVGGDVVGGEEDGFAGEGGFESVEAGDLLAGFGSGA